MTKNRQKTDSEDGRELNNSVGREGSTTANYGIDVTIGGFTSITTFAVDSDRNIIEMVKQEIIKEPNTVGFFRACLIWLGKLFKVVK